MICSLPLVPMVKRIFSFSVSTSTRIGIRIGLISLAEGSCGPVIGQRMVAPERPTIKTSPPASGPESTGSVVQKVKLPWVPFKSGTHIPLRHTPLNSSGGKVIGTRMMLEKMPLSPRVFHHGVPLRSKRMLEVGRLKNSFLPILSNAFSPVVISVEERTGK